MTHIFSNIEGSNIKNTIINNNLDINKLFIIGNIIDSTSINESIDNIDNILNNKSSNLEKYYLLY